MGPGEHRLKAIHGAAQLSLGLHISVIRLSTRVHPNRAAKPPCLDGPHLKNLKPTQLSVENHGFPPVDNFIHSRRTLENSSLDPNYPQA